MLNTPVIRSRWERRARKLIDAGRYNEAHELLLKQEGGRSSIKCRMYRASVLLLLGESAESERLFSEVITEAGESTSIYLHAGRGHSRLHLGRHDEAEHDYRMAVAAREVPEVDRQAVRPRDPGESPEYLLACLAMGLGLWREALHEFRLVLTRYPDHEESHRQVAMLLAGSPDPGVRDGEQSLRHAALLKEDGWSKYSLLAAGHAECEDFQKAIHWAQKAHDAAPEPEKPIRAQRIKQYKRHEPFRLDQTDEAS